MHKLLNISVLAGLALAFAVTVAPAPADAQSGVSLVKERQALMRQNSKNFRVVRGYLKTGAGSPADVAASAKKIATIAGQLPGMFPKGTSTDDLGIKVSGSKPVIWAKFDDFKAASSRLASLAMKLNAAADSGDKKQIAAAAGALGKQGCGGCHRTFRQKRPKK